MTIHRAELVNYLKTGSKNWDRDSSPRRELAMQLPSQQNLWRMFSYSSHNWWCGVYQLQFSLIYLFSHAQNLKRELVHRIGSRPNRREFEEQTRACRGGVQRHAVLLSKEDH